MAPRAHSGHVKAKRPRVPIIEPMEARSIDSFPDGEQWQFEPKWDGFRCILVRNRETAVLRSKSGEDLTRYFPELVDAALKIKARTFTLDGEIVVPDGKTFSFDALLQRIHPAATRVSTLAQETPALFIAFDLLAAGPVDLTGRRLAERGARTLRKAIQGERQLSSFDIHHALFGFDVRTQDSRQWWYERQMQRTSRWSTRRSSEWTPVKPQFVVEVSYDHFTGGRFR